MDDYYTSLYYPTWTHIQKGCSVLSKKIAEEKSESCNVILGIGPNGFIPAVIVSEILDIPCIGANFRSNQAKSPNLDGIIRSSMPQISLQLTSGNGILPDIPTVIIIDSIVNSGHTLDELADHYSTTGHKIITAALYYRTGAALKPDIYWNIVRKKDPNIEFPWEI